MLDAHFLLPCDLATPPLRPLCSGMTLLPVLQRIMGVKYSFPTNLHISRECLDMMSKIFVGNPANRISIAGIKSHPWFTKNLPDELKVGDMC